MTDKPVSVINDVGTEVDVDVTVTVSLEGAQRREGIDWGDIESIEVRVKDIES